MRRFTFLALLCALVCTGCVRSRITNLTTTRQPRNPAGLYPIEFVWDSNQQSLIDSSIKPVVVVGFEQYPMRPALDIANRWEAVVPVPPNQGVLVYHFKVDYQYRDFGGPSKGSKLSPSYRLDIYDK